MYYMAFKKMFADLWFTIFTYDVIVDMVGLNLPSCYGLICPLVLFFSLSAVLWTNENFFIISPYFLSSLISYLILCYFTLVYTVYHSLSSSNTPFYT